MGTKRALVVGAGIGGLAAALALKRAGWSVRVFEKASTPRELGFALSLAPNAIAAMRELGVAEEVVRGGYAARRVEFRGAHGRRLRYVDASHMLVEGVVAMRPVVHGALLNAVADTLTLSHDATRFVAAEEGITLEFADGTRADGEMLVGADGIGSAVRRQLHPGERAMQPSGYAAIRGAVDEVGMMLGGLDAVLYFAGRMEAAAVRAGPQSAYWYMSLLSRDVGSRQEDTRALARQCASALDDTFRRVIAATRDEDLRFDALHQRAPLSKWGQGRVTLLGDAAHPMLPHTGQGAAQAIEDAVALGLAVARQSNVARALRLYESVRAARTERIVARGPRIASITTTGNPMVSGLRNAMLRFAPASIIVKALQNLDRRDPHATLR